MKKVTTPPWDEINCTVLALYGIDTSAELAGRFYHSALSWFRVNGHWPNRIGVRGPGFSGKEVDFSKVNNRLQRRGFKDVANIILVTMFPGGQIPVRDWLLTVDWSANERSAVIAAESPIVPFRSEGFRRYAEEVVRLLRPEYGIAYQMPHFLAPDMYAFGIGQQLGTILTGEAYEEARNRSRWLDMGMVQSVWRAGVIRDVYPWNFLTAPQLDAKV